VILYFNPAASALDVSPSPPPPRASPACLRAPPESQPETTATPRDTPVHLPPSRPSSQMPSTAFPVPSFCCYAWTGSPTTISPPPNSANYTRDLNTNAANNNVVTKPSSVFAFSSSIFPLHVRKTHSPRPSGLTAGPDREFASVLSSTYVPSTTNDNCGRPVEEEVLCSRSSTVAQVRQV